MPIKKQNEGQQFYGNKLTDGNQVQKMELIGKEKVPVIVKELDDDMATILLVDSNLQRENILPSEKAHAYRMKMEALRRKAGRPTKGYTASPSIAAAATSFADTSSPVSMRNPRL